MARASALARWPRVRAPGKVVLAGEYGLLAGGEGLVMAVDRHGVTTGEGDDGATGEATGFFDAAVTAAGTRAAALPAGTPIVDTTALHAGEKKLGLGSSAAWIACLTGSVFAAAGHDLSDPAVRRRVLGAARGAHRAARGGSGADVATAVLGGVVRFRDPGLGDDAVEAERIDLPAASIPLVVAGGAPVSTARAIARFDGPEGRAVLEEAAGIGDALTAALVAGGGIAGAVRDADALLARIARLADLGAGAGTEALAAARAAAAEFSGAVKPSGAGAGDLVLVFVPEVAPNDRPRVRAALEARGLEVLDLHLDPTGLVAIP